MMDVCTAEIPRSENCASHVLCLFNCRTEDHDFAQLQWFLLLLFVLSRLLVGFILLLNKQSLEIWDLSASPHSELLSSVEIGNLFRGEVTLLVDYSFKIFIDGM